MNEILRLKNLCFAYESGRRVLDDLSVALYAGERVAVLGNNGAGKSTFFRCCNGVLQPSAGEIWLEGVQVGKGRAERTRLRRAVGLVFQDPESQLLAGTVESEVSFGPMNLRLSEAEVRARVDDAIANMNLEAYRARAPQYLSGGEKKRVGIADVLAMAPKLMLLDEPAASLDPAGAQLLERNLQALYQRGLGVVIATHDVDFVWRWAERVLVFRDGRLCADASPYQIFSNRALLDQCALAPPILFQVGERLGMDPPPRTVEEITSTATRAKTAV